MRIELGDTPTPITTKEDTEVVNPLLVDWNNEVPDIASLGFGVKNIPDIEEEMEIEDDTLANCSF